MSNFYLSNFANSQVTSQGKVLKIILWVLAIIVIIIGLALYFTSGISGAAREQLATLKAGNISAAYQQTSKAFQQQTSLEDFQNYLRKYPILTNYQDVTFTERSIENGMGYLAGTIEGADGSKMKIEYQLVKEDGVWKIQAINLSPAGIDTTQNNIKDDSNSTIHDVLINDKADTNGYVADSKETLSKSAPKIFATIRIVAPSGRGEVTATLTQPDGQKIGPSVAKITKSGNIMKAFSFTRSRSSWPAGEYIVTVQLSSGETKTVKFAVK